MKDTVLSTPATETTPCVDTTEVRKASFWISQIFILAATVCGVFLAASQGFKQAIAYEKLMSDKSNYYLRQSLRNELADNVETVKAYMVKLEKDRIGARTDPFQLDTFVWDTMKFSPATLETPSDLLGGSRRFYRGVTDIHQAVATSKTSPEKAIKQLAPLVEEIETVTIPGLERNLDELKAFLNKNKIAL